jgi:tetratricopeptide (TPR) repeat protein
MKIVSTTLLGPGSEEKVGPAIASVAHYVDEIIIVDTTNGVETTKCRELIVNASRLSRNPPCIYFVNTPWKDFSICRNRALQIAADRGADYAITLDTDERLHFEVEPNQFKRNEVRTACLQELDVICSPAVLAGVDYFKERIIKTTREIRWSGPTHEALLGWHSRTMCNWLKFSELAKSAESLKEKFERDYALLEKYAPEHPEDGRWWYYLGYSAHQIGRHREEDFAYRQCIRVSTWDEEAGWAAFELAKCTGLLELSRHSSLPLSRTIRETIEICALGMTRHAAMPELPWYAAWTAYQAKDFEQAIRWADIAISLGKDVRRGSCRTQRIGFQYAPAHWEAPYQIKFHAYREMGDTESAEVAHELYAGALTRRLVEIL